MKQSLPWDVRAVLASPGKALALKKIFSSALVLTIGYLWYFILTYIALRVEGVGLDYIWQSYGLFPVRLFPFDRELASWLQYIGIIGSIMALSAAIMACAVIHFEELRGNLFFSARDALRFTVSRFSTLLLGFVTLSVFVGIVYLLGLVAGLIGRLPWIGDILVSVFYLVPVFITLIFTVFIIFVGIVGIFLLPVVIASHRQKELFGPLLLLFSILIKQPVRFFWYFAVSGVLAKLASFVMAYFFYRTIQFSRLVLIQGGGEKMERLFNAAYALLPFNAPAVMFVTTIFPWVPFGFAIERWGFVGDIGLAAVLLALSLFLLYIFLLGYILATLTVGLTRGYVVIRKLKDDVDLTMESPLGGDNSETFTSQPQAT